MLNEEIQVNVVSLSPNDGWENKGHPKGHPKGQNYIKFQFK